MISILSTPRFRFPLVVTILGLFCLHWPLMGAPVSPERAAAAVHGWLRTDRTPVGERLSATVRNIGLFNDSQGNPLYYVASLEPSGFVVVAAEDQVEPIIAFSRNGSFVREAGNPLADLVDKDMGDRLTRVQSLRAVAPGASATKWSRLALAAGSAAQAQSVTLAGPSDVRVAPFVTSHWSQTDSGGAACYNYYTPKGPAGNLNNYPCGCVATAMAQMMRFYRYPTRAVGTAAFSIGVDGQSTTARLRGGNGSGGAYPWDSMPLDPAAASTLAQRQAIGALTYDAGIASLMGYFAATNGGSGAYLNDARNAFVGVFGYGNAIYGINSQTASDALPGMINPNLDARLPVLLGIYGPGPKGHAVVCDGYGYSVGTLYHHLNLGWAGNDDAWYALPVIKTSNGAFTSVPDVIYNVFVSGGGEIISGRILENTGLPISNVTVTAMSQSGLVYSGSTDTNGIYSMTGVDADTQYAISVSRSGFFPTNGSCLTGQSISGWSSSGNAWGVDFSMVRIGPPIIQTQPVSQTLSQGKQAVFAVEIAGQMPLFINWYRDGVPLAGETNATLILNNAQMSDSGAEFQCRVTNAMGSAASQAVTLTVSPVTLDHFLWSTIPSPQATNSQFEVSVTAQDSLGTTVSNFSGTVSLSGTAWMGADIFLADFESGDLSAWINQGGAYTDQITGDAAVGSKCLSLTGGAGTNAYDGLQHTFATPVRPDRISFYIRGSVTDQAAGYVVVGAAKFRTNSVAHFRLNDDGTMGLTDGAVQWHGVPYEANRWYKIALDIHWDARTLDYYVDDTLAAGQVSFCNSNVTAISVINLYNVGNAEASWDQIELMASTGTQPVAINPSQLGAFADGVWNGSVIVLQRATNLVLRADDGQGHWSVSNPFAVNGTPGLPPVITVQPSDQRVPIGGDATFSVGVSGPPPMTFSWMRDGQAIPGAHDTNYTLRDVAVSDSQSRFGCLVMNGAGSVSSVAARLIVVTTNHMRAAVFTTGSRSALQNNDVKAKLVGTGLFDAADVDLYSLYDPAFPDLTLLRQYAAVLIYSSTQYPDATRLGNTLADYVDGGGAVVLACDALSSDAGYGVAGRLASGGYLPFIAGSAEPGGTDSPLPDMTLVADLPDHPLLNGVKTLDNGMSGNRDAITVAPGATRIAHWSTMEPLAVVKETSGNRVVALNFRPPSSDAVSGNWDPATDGALLMANALHWASRDGAQMPASIVSQPGNQLVALGGTVSFSVVCSGAAPLTYQWKKGSTPLLDGPGVTGATKPTLIFASVSWTDAGTYSVAVSNAFGSAVSTSTVLTVLAPPSIEIQPSNLTAAAGSRMTLSASVSGSQPLHYQWRKNRIDLPNKGVFSGANSPTLVLTGAGPGDSGTYSLAVSNSFGAAVSEPAVVTILAKPTIVTPPASYVGGLGKTAIFTVAARGDGLSFQWKHGATLLGDGENLAGSLTTTLKLNSIAASDAGDYSVLVSNIAGCVESKAAKLTVILPPSLLVQPLDQTAAFGSNVTFRVAAAGALPLVYRWFKDGVRLSDVAGKIAGTGSSNLVIRTAGGIDPGIYSVLVTNSAGSITSLVARLRVGPSVSVAGPATLAIVTNSLRRVTGLAGDAGGPGLSRVLWQLNGQGFQPVYGVSNWTVQLNLPPGTNIFAAKSVDLDGLDSSVVYRSLYFNPFAALAGGYNLLFSEADSPRPGRSGFITLTVSASGSYSGKMYIGGANCTILGKFSLDGRSHLDISALSLGLDLNLDLGNTNGAMGGQIIGPGWVAPISGFRASYSASQAITGTLAFSDADLLSSGPDGAGFATASISAKGNVTLTGRLSDDAPLTSISALMGADGKWPLYGSLYGGKGMVLGWLAAQSGIIEGSLTWVKPAGSGTNFPGGFTNQLEALGSVLPRGARLIRWTNGVAILSGGALAAPLTNNVIFGAGNVITILPGQTNGMQLSVNAASGQITGSFIDPVSRQKRVIRGAVLNQQNEARGYFTAPQPGFFLLRARVEP